MQKQKGFCLGRYDLFNIFGTGIQRVRVHIAEHHLGTMSTNGIAGSDKTDGRENDFVTGVYIQKLHGGE